jgi:hypothetical protein
LYWAERKVGFGKLSAEKIGLEPEERGGTNVRVACFLLAVTRPPQSEFWTIYEFGIQRADDISAGCLNNSLSVPVRWLQGVNRNLTSDTN